ncbi:conjugal transfer protein TraF [uncultured Photobacterium sp.]|uniref:conjugal transfer protein TraF n=1 Tax=uncultured Photobacterium sp. TaxID=173973 RepID=UPI002639E556|nr:conjugal transfer protein TraF [uncultured Photobacterium sp.]
MKTVLLISLLSLPVMADNYISSDDEPGGWHYYVDPAKERDPEKKEPPKVVQAQAQSPTPQAKPLSAAWIRTMWPKFVDAAIDDPSDSNIKRVRYMQRVIMDKSSLFSDAFMRDVISNPVLDETIARPVSQFGLLAKTDAIYGGKDNALKEISNKAGLWFFFQSTCPYCNKQAPLMQRLKDRGFDIAAISLDGAPLSSGFFPRYVIDHNGLARQLGVMRVPAMFLVSNDATQIMPLGQGLQTESELITIMLKQAKGGGIIDKGTYDSAVSVSTLPQISNLDMLDPDKAANDPDYLYRALEENLKAQQGVMF